MNRRDTECYLVTTNGRWKRRSITCVRKKDREAHVSPARAQSYELLCCCAFFWNKPQDLNSNTAFLHVSTTEVNSSIEKMIVWNVRCSRLTRHQVYNTSAAAATKSRAPSLSGVLSTTFAPINPRPSGTKHQNSHSAPPRYTTCSTPYYNSLLTHPQSTSA